MQLLNLLLFSFKKVNEAKRTQQEYYEMELKTLQNRLEGEVAQLNEAHSKTLEELAWKHHMAIEAAHSNASRDKRKLQVVSASWRKSRLLSCHHGSSGGIHKSGISSLPPLETGPHYEAQSPRHSPASTSQAHAPPHLACLKFSVGAWFISADNFIRAITEDSLFWGCLIMR